MPGNQTTIQQLIQQLVPSGVNNGNPNTVYNTSATPYNGGTQPVPLPPMQDAQGNWFMNSVSNAANMGPINLQAMPAPVLGQPWQPSYSTQARLPTWPTPFDPAQYGTAPTAPPATGGPAIPSTPVTPPTAPPAAGGGGVGSVGFDPNGGFGGYEGCVVIESYLEDYDRADDVQFGDTMVVIDPVTFKRSTGEVSYSETKLMPCVRITTESGIELECSTTAPIADELGQQVKAPDLLNKRIPVYDRGSFYLDRVSSVEDIGEKEVRHITVENNFFLAGKEKGRYIFHHNMKMVPGTGVDLLGMYAARDAQFGWGRDMGGFGAESMGTWSPNTRGAIKAANANYAPTGQGIIDAFGEAPEPATGDSMSNNPWSELNTNPYDSQWFQDRQLYQNGTSNTGTPVGQAEGANSSFWDSIKTGASTIADWFLPGNQYHSDNKQWAPGESVGMSIIDLLAGAGGLGVKGMQQYGESNLADGYNSGSSAERAALGQLQYSYQQSTPVQQAAAIKEMRDAGWSQSVIDSVTSGKSAWSK